MPMATMTQGAGNYGGEGVFFEKQSSMQNFLGGMTMSASLKKGMCLTLVLSWLASGTPEKGVVSGVASKIKTADSQDDFVKKWTGYADVQLAATKKLTDCVPWFSDNQVYNFDATRKVNRDIFTNKGISGREARFIFCIQTAAHDYSHAIGIWKMKNDKDIYVYDPNHGGVRIPAEQIYNFLGDFVKDLYSSVGEYYISAFCI